LVAGRTDLHLGSTNATPKRWASVGLEREKTRMDKVGSPEGEGRRRMMTCHQNGGIAANNHAIEPDT